MKNNHKYTGKETLEVLSWALRYNSWIASQFIPHIHGKKILEIGAGTGTISKLLSPYASKYDATDRDRDLIRFMKQENGSKMNRRYFSLDISKKIPERLKNKYDAVISVNVLEHIKHDMGALRNMKQLLRRGGTLLLLVPAKQFAYTDLDRKLGHFRRYEKHELEHIISKAGFTIRTMYFFNLVGLMTWIIRNVFDRDADRLKPYQIWFFEHLVPILSTIETVIHPPVGISLIVVAEKG